MKSIGLVVIALGVAVALLATGAAVAFAVRAERAEMQTALAAAVPSPHVASIKVYDGAGKLVRESGAVPFRPPLFALASRLAPAEVACNGIEGGTVCVETSPAPLARQLRSLFVAGGVAVGGAILLGLLAALALHRSIAAPMRSMADVVDKASHERAYSLRVEPAPGDLGRMAASINDLLSQIQQRDVDIRRRTIELEAVNKELEAFAYSVSHDLRAPLGSIDGFTQALELDYADVLDATAKEYITWVRQGCHQMRELIDGMLQMTRLARADMERVPVDLSAIAQSVADALKQSQPDRPVKFDIRDGMKTFGDERLLRAVLENLMANAWKFTRNRGDARIEVGLRDGAYYVRDNGAGFDPSHAAKMFRPFQRLHSSREFEGTGIGLATVQKIIERHGGRAWAEGEVDKGATIYFTTAERA
jgi:signal transduction histidine kinase